MDYDEQALLDGLMEEISKNTIYSRLGRETFVKISNLFYEKLFAIAPSMSLQFYVPTITFSDPFLESNVY